MSNEVRAYAYNMASGINQEIIAEMAREFEQELIISGNVPLSIVRQRKAEERRLSQIKDSSKYNSTSEGSILFEKRAVMLHYALQLMNDLQFPNDVEIRYSENELSIISGAVQKTYEIKAKKGKVVDIKYKKKRFVEK